MDAVPLSEQCRHNPYSMHEYDSFSNCMEGGEGESDYSEGEGSDCMSEYSDYTRYVECMGKYEQLSEYEVDQMTREGRIFVIQIHIMPINADASNVTGVVAE